MGGTGTLVTTLVVYHLMLLGIGAWAARRTRDGADFYLGGRGLGPWIASLSSAASSSSAWTLLGVSGAAYTSGLSAFWLMPACVLGFAFNWLVVARPLRRLSAETGAVTLTEFLAHGAPPRPARAIAISASLIVLVSLGVYVASQFQGAGKTFAELLGTDPTHAVLLGGAVVVLYTMVGGFWAVSVTDFVQGLVMAAASVIVPVAALIATGGWVGMFDGLRTSDPALLDLWDGKGGPALLGFLIGTLGIGLGYPGQPHVVNRFMAMRDDRDIRRGAWISLAWALVIYNGMLVSGWCARSLVETVSDNEAILLAMTERLFPPAVAGIIVAAVLSAIMSTADSQLLVCGSTVAHDIPRRKARRKVLLDRVTVLLLSTLAILAALFVQETIFNTVLFAWSALGAAFGPLLLVRLYRGPVRPGWALASIWVGFLVTLAWYFGRKFHPGFRDAVFNLYELPPAFLAAWIPAWIGVQRRGAD